MKVRNLDLQRTVFVVFRIMKEMNGRSLVMTKQSILVFFYCSVQMLFLHLFLQYYC